MTIETCAMPIDGHAQSGSCTLGPGQSLHSQACASNQAQCLALRFVLLRAVFGARFCRFFLPWLFLCHEMANKRDRYCCPVHHCPHAVLCARVSLSSANTFVMRVIGTQCGWFIVILGVQSCGHSVAHLVCCFNYSRWVIGMVLDAWRLRNCFVSCSSYFR